MADINDGPKAIAAELQKTTGKVVASFTDDDGERQERQLVITFADGTRLVVEYDWIYSVTMHESETGV